MELLNNSCTYLEIISAKITPDQLALIHAAENKQQYFNEHFFEYDVKFYVEGIETDITTVNFNSQEIPLAFEKIHDYIMTGYEDGYYVVSVKNMNCELKMNISAESFAPENASVKYHEIVIPQVNTFLIAGNFIYDGVAIDSTIKATLNTHGIYLLEKIDDNFILL